MKAPERAVLCLLEYRKTGNFGKAIESELERVRFRILTD